MPNMGEHNGERQGGNNTETPQRVGQEMEMREKSDFENIIWQKMYFLWEKKLCQKKCLYKELKPKKGTYIYIDSIKIGES